MVVDTRCSQKVHDIKGLNHWLVKLQQDVSFQPLVFTCTTACWRSIVLKPHLPHSQRRKSMPENYHITGRSTCEQAEGHDAAIVETHVSKLRDTMLQSSRHISVWKTSATIAVCTPMHSVCTQWSFRGPTVHCALITPNNALNRRGKQHFWEMC
jgi:hypothetical protein